jgi:hypothetical protein
MANNRNPASAPPRPRQCPVCRRPAVKEWWPFCSKRCADIDLGRWLGEVYRIPGEEADAPPAEPPADDES